MDKDNFNPAAGFIFIYNDPPPPQNEEKGELCIG